MRYRFNLYAVSLLVLATAGCGGGINSTPTPPSPAPSPSPTPVTVGETPPELPPTLTGTLAQAYQTDQDFRTGSTEIVEDIEAGTLQTRNKAYQSSTGIRLYYDKSTGTYTVSNLDIGNAYHLPTETSEEDDHIGYTINETDGTRGLALLKPDNTKIALTYTSYGLWQFNSTDRNVTPSADDRHYFYFGIPTADADVPRTGAAHYSGIAEGVLFTPDTTYALNGTTTLDADFGASSLTADLLLSGVDQTSNAPLSLPDFTGSASIAAGKNGFVGTLSSADSSYVGSIQGAFFGPHAEEFGYSWAINNPELTNLGGGVAVGKR